MSRWLLNRRVNGTWGDTYSNGAVLAAFVQVAQTGEKSVPEIDALLKAERVHAAVPLWSLEFSQYHLVEPVRLLPAPVSLKAIKAEPALAAMELLRQSRLSVAPVRDAEWEQVLAMSEAARATPTSRRHST